MPKEHPGEEEPERRLREVLRGAWQEASEKYFEKLFILTVLVSVGAISFLVDDKLALLNFYFIPVLLAGYFLDLRSAVLGAVLSILWVGLGVLLDPEAFYLPPSPQVLYLHLVAWGGFLILCGALVGRLNEQLLEKFARLKQVLRQWHEVQEQLDASSGAPEERQAALEGLRARVESVVFSSMDAVTAQLAAQDRLPLGQRRAAVLWAELSGARDAALGTRRDDWFADVNSSLSQIEPVVSAYQGHLDRFTDGGLVAEFGLMTPAAQSALLGVTAALTMQQKVAERSPRWPLKVALSEGPLLAGLLGTPPRRSYTAVGEAVEEAGRLRRLARPGSVCVSPAVHAQLQGGVHSRPVSRKRPDGTDPREELLKLEARIDYKNAGLDDYLEAGRLASDLGDHDRSVAYYVMALNLNPPGRKDIEARIEAVKSQAESSVAVESETSLEAEAFEITALRDPLEDTFLVPGKLRARAQALFAKLRLHSEMLLPLEAVKGSIGHSRVSAAVAAALASAMGLSDQEVEAAFLAGFFHEIGLTDLPPSVADKDATMPGLPRRELDLLRTHPSLAQQALKDLGIEVPAPALDAIRQHLENLDGSGPQRLPGGAVTPLARAVRLAHEYDSLVSWKPYRKPWSRAAALNSMKLDAEGNRRLDPRILELLESFFRDSPSAP